jgi:hypothetical protein
MLPLCKAARGRPLQVAPLQDRTLGCDGGWLLPPGEVGRLRLLHRMLLQLLLTEYRLHVRPVMVVVELSKQVLIDLESGA